MLAHTPTLYLMVVAVSLALAVSVATLSDFKSRQHEGMWLWAAGMGLFGLTYALFGLRGRISDLLSVVLANAALSATLVLLTLAMLRFQRRRAPRVLLWLPVGLVALVMALSDSSPFRLLTMAVVLGCQSVTLVVIVLQRHAATVGRGKYLVVLALLIAIGIFVSRIVGVYLGLDQSVAVDRSSPIQTVTHMLGTIGIILLTVGFVIMTKERADSLNLLLAMRDELTQLHNRRAILEALQQQMAAAQRTGSPLCVLMLDVDHFKRLNDAYGHVAGDQVLRGIADAIRPRLRTQDIAGRMGGEEFLVVLPHSGLEAAGQIAERLRQAVHGTAFPLAVGQPVSVSVSVGGARYNPAQHPDCDSLIHQADQALYAAKSNGRNRVELMPDPLPLPRQKVA